MNRPFHFSFKCAAKGIARTFLTERSFRLQLIIFAIAVIAGLIFKISPFEWISLLLTSGFVLAMEIINTAFEKTVDLVTEEFKVLAQNIKDICAGAVLVASFFSIVIGLIIFIPHFLKLIK